MNFIAEENLIPNLCWEYTVGLSPAVSVEVGKVVGTIIMEVGMVGIIFCR